MQKSYEEIVSKIQEFELTNKVDNFPFQGVDLWPLIRFKLFMKLIGANSSGNQKKKYLQTFCRLMTAFIASNSKIYRQLKKSRYLFFGSANARRASKEEKKYHIFLDALIEKYNISDYLILELNDTKTHEKKFSKNVVDIDSLMIKNLFFAKILVFFTPHIRRKIKKVTQQWQGSIFTIKKTEIQKMLHEAFLEYRTNSSSLQKIIQIVQPKAVFLTCSYCNWINIVVQYSNNSNITTIELQHGIIHNFHVGYIYSKKHSGQSVPSYFLAFGKKEYDILSNVFDSKILIEGNDYFQLMQSGITFDQKSVFEIWPQIKDKKIILVTSQGLTGEKLTQFFSKVASILPKEYIIIYRLHQNERLLFDKKKYENLISNKNVVIQTDDTITLYQLLQHAYVHVSVFSTVLEEALAFSVPNIIVTQNGWENVKYLIDKGLGIPANTPENFIKALSMSKKIYKADLEYFYSKSSDSLKKILLKLK